MSLMEDGHVSGRSIAETDLDPPDRLGSVYVTLRPHTSPSFIYYQ